MLPFGYLRDAQKLISFQ